MFYFSFTIIQEVVASGHNKSCAASGCSRSLAGPLGQLYIVCWPSGPARYLLLAQRASKSLKTLKWINSWRVKCDGDHVQNKFGGLMVNQDLLSYLTFNLLDVNYLRLALWASWILLPARVWTISCGLWPIYMKCLSIKYLPEVPSH